jgi:hypothetical protein
MTTLMLLKTATQQAAFCMPAALIKEYLLLGDVRAGGKVAWMAWGSYGVEKLTWFRMLPEMGPA